MPCTFVETSKPDQTGLGLFLVEEVRIHRTSTKGEEMNRNTKSPSPLQDVNIDVKTKLSGLWVALMFFYIYADILGSHKQGYVEALQAGEVAGLTPAWVLGSAVLMAIPSVMVFLSLALKAKVNRWANIGVGIVYVAVLGAFLFIADISADYLFYSVVEAVLIALIVWHAWKWPKEEGVEVAP
jgi:hypothetical protein